MPDGFTVCPWRLLLLVESGSRESGYKRMGKGGRNIPHIPNMSAGKFKKSLILMQFFLHERGCVCYGHVLHFSNKERECKVLRLDFNSIEHFKSGDLNPNQWDGEKCTRAEVTHLASSRRGFLSCPEFLPGSLTCSSPWRRENAGSRWGAHRRSAAPPLVS